MIRFLVYFLRNLFNSVRNCNGKLEWSVLENFIRKLSHNFKKFSTSVFFLKIKNKNSCQPWPADAELHSEEVEGYYTISCIFLWNLFNSVGNCNENQNGKSVFFIKKNFLTPTCRCQTPRWRSSRTPAWRCPPRRRQARPSRSPTAKRMYLKEDNLKTPCVLKVNSWRNLKQLCASHLFQDCFLGVWNPLWRFRRLPPKECSSTVQEPLSHTLKFTY